MRRAQATWASGDLYEVQLETPDHTHRLGAERRGAWLHTWGTFRERIPVENDNPGGTLLNALHQWLERRRDAA